eukprot:scaffold443_cov527-Prasinococcus_capsulatus_cf.AAC.15
MQNAVHASDHSRAADELEELLKFFAENTVAMTLASVYAIAFFFTVLFGMLLSDGKGKVRRGRRCTPVCVDACPNCRALCGLPVPSSFLPAEGPGRKPHVLGIACGDARSANGGDGVRGARYAADAERAEGHALFPLATRRAATATPELSAWLVR